MKISKNNSLSFFATTPKGLELLLVEELKTLGATHAAEKLAGVEFTGTLELAYKACLWSRLANRILLPLTKVPANTPEELYAGVQSIQWDEHFNPTNTLHVNFVCSQSKITHTLFGAQKVKDAIVDQFRDKYGERPTVARQQPDISINVYLYRDVATISLDLSGDSLHKRGYRLEQGAAPLKENLAAAILLRSKWQDIASQGGMLLDPMCGSGTLLIEAALMAGNIAPGLFREYFGFLKWQQHDALIWKKILAEAKQLQDKAIIPTIIGCDVDTNAIKISFANIERAGLHGKVHVEKRELSHCIVKKEFKTGLFITNPPYGERLGELDELGELYAKMGEKLKQDFVGWHAAVFTGNPDLGKTMGIRAHHRYALFNGAIPCQLLLFDVQPEWFVNRAPENMNERLIRHAQLAMTPAQREAVQMVANRLIKKMKHLKSWVKRENIFCYRLYHADLPEFGVTIDFYHDKVLVEELPTQKNADIEKSKQRVLSVLAILPETLNVPAANIFFRDYLQSKKPLPNLPEFAEVLQYPK